MRSVAARIVLVGAACIIFFAALELSLFWLTRAGRIAIAPPPSSGDRFWNGRHPEYGVWRYPDTTWEHETDCFSVHYETNSVGARDPERLRAATGPRTIVLGDSFIDGWGVPAGQRMSDILETETGIEHLNFGMSHFSPYQSYLVYRDLASTYEHDTVVIGVLPSNDFLDLDLERSRLLPGYEFFYRPYPVRDGDRFVHRDYRENRMHRLLRRHTYTFHAARTAQLRLRQWTGARPMTAGALGVSAGSSFSDFSDDDLDRLRHSLQLIIEHAAGRRVIVLLIPVLRDLQAHDGSTPTPLARRLEPLLDFGDVTILDLLPLLAEGTEEPRRYYFGCDSHWNAAGNRAAARHLRALYSGLSTPDENR